MIELKEIKNRVYDHKTLVRFDVEIKTEEEAHRVVFEKTAECQWGLTFILPRTSFCDSKVYYMNYMVPMKSPNLELIASMGLKMLQAIIKEDTQKLSTLDFTIGHLIGE